MAKEEIIMGTTEEVVDAIVDDVVVVDAGTGFSGVRLAVGLAGVIGTGVALYHGIKWAVKKYNEKKAAAENNTDNEDDTFEDEDE